MKKLLIIMVALAVAFSAGAWSRNLDKGVLLLASKSLTPKAQRVLTNYVGEDHSKPAGHLAWHRKNGRHLETEGWHTLHLNAELQPSAQDENDALVQIEKALEVIKNRKKHTTAEVSFAITPADTDIAKLSKEKQAEIHAIADRQAQRAAYRLAAVLNEIFKE